MSRALAFLLFAAAASASPPPREATVAFVAPLSGAMEGRSREILAGVEAAAAEWGGFSIVAVDDGDDPEAYAKGVRRALAKEKLTAILAAPSGRCLAAFSEMARRARVPCVLVGGWEPLYSLDPEDPLLHAGAGAVDRAMAAAGYSLLPLEATRAAAVHDGSPPAVALAEAYVRNLPPRIAPGGAHAYRPGLLAALAEDGVDLVFVAADAGAALAFAREAASSPAAPRVLFCDGSVHPALVAAAPPSARFLEQVFVYFERNGRYRRARAEKGLPPSPLAERGYGVLALVAEALQAAEGDRRRLLAELRDVADRDCKDATVFTEWGQARLSEFYLHEPKEGRTQRMEPLYLPDRAGGFLLGFLPPSRFQLDPDSQMVLLTWGGEGVATIDKDLHSIGLFTRGYHPDMDAAVKDGVLARAMSKLHRLYWRNADGTPIPGVSFNVTFGLELPADVEPNDVWTVTVAGDDPDAGGRAFPPNRASTYSTFLVRTIYRQHAMDPPLGFEDTFFFQYKYRWGTSAEQNIRMDRVRSLIDGLAGAIALTTAHECGHLAGCGHDTSSPRSIMNVEEGAGLDPAWVEWVPEHLELLERSVGRVAQPGRRRR